MFTTFIGSIEEIQKHKTFISVKESLQALFSCLEINEISVRVFKNAIKNKEILCDLFAYLQIQVKSAKRQFKIERKVCKERIERISKFVDEYEAKLEAVESAINICRIVSKKVNIEISDFEKVITDLENCKRDEHLVSSSQSDDFWGILSFALKPSEVLTNLSESMSFKRVAERCWARDHGKTPPQEITLSDLLKFLTGTCIDTFRTEWVRLLLNPDDGGHTIQKLGDLVGYNVSEEDVKKEIAILVTKVGKKIKIHDKFKNYLNSYSKRSQIREDVQIALSVLQTLGVDSKPDSPPVIEILQSFELQVEDETNLSIKMNHVYIQKVQKHLMFSKDTKSVLQQLHMSSEVLKFVQKTINEDLHFMVEEMEEHAEQLKVTELLVTKLIDVHQFLGKIIKLAQSSTSVKEVFSLAG